MLTSSDPTSTSSCVPNPIGRPSAPIASTNVQMAIPSAPPIASIAIQPAGAGRVRSSG